MTTFLKESKAVLVCQCVMSCNTGQTQQWTNLKMSVSSTESLIFSLIYPSFLNLPPPHTHQKRERGRKTDYSKFWQGIRFASFS